jgi:2-oxo-4-hydroxy-4-carboxy--5-ureidoimidazoline (OHCU) decarboxylase
LNRLAPQAAGRTNRAAEALARALLAATESAERKSFLAALIAMPSMASLKATRAQLKNPTLGAEAAAGLVKIAEVIYPWHKGEVQAALEELNTISLPAEIA